MLLKNPNNGRIVDVTGARATTLRARGFTEVALEDRAAALASMSATGDKPSAVQPQPPIDARQDPPEPAVDARPDDAVTDAPIDTRPPNPLGPVADSVAEADGAGLDEAPDDADQAPEPADGEDLSKLSRADLDDRAAALGVEDPDKLPNKGAVIDAIEASRG